MKQLVSICILAIGMIANAQKTTTAVTTQIFSKPIKLMAVPSGFTTDKILVRGTDKIIKEISPQSFTTNTIPTLQEIVNKGGGDLIGYQKSEFDQVRSNINAGSFMTSIRSSFDNSQIYSELNHESLNFGMYKTTSNSGLTLKPNFTIGKNNMLEIPAITGSVIALNTENSILDTVAKLGEIRSVMCKSDWICLFIFTNHGWIQIGEKYIGRTIQR